MEIRRPPGLPHLSLVRSLRAVRTRKSNTPLADAGLRITLPQATVLFLLTEKDCRMMSELGRIIGVDNSAMTGLVDRLEKAGFVRREAKQEDRRALLIRITPEGREKAVKAAKIIHGVNEKIREGLRSGSDRGPQGHSSRCPRTIEAHANRAELPGKERTGPGLRALSPPAQAGHAGCAPGAKANETGGNP